MALAHSDCRIKRRRPPRKKVNEEWGRKEGRKAGRKEGRQAGRKDFFKNTFCELLSFDVRYLKNIKERESHIML